MVHPLPFASVLFGLCLVLLSAPVGAQEVAGQAEAQAESSDDAKKFDDLLKGLDAQEYVDRQAASKALGEEGVKALPALEKGVQSESREVSLRCFDLIKKLHESNDASTKEQVKATLQRLAELENNNSVSSRAKKMLTPPAQPTPKVPNAAPGIRVIPGGVVPGGAVPLGGIRLEVRAIGGAGAKRIQVKDVNGVRDIEATEEGRKVKIHDEPGKGIQVEITETKDGKDETKKYEAKDADELKKNHPDAHKAYEEYGKKAPIKFEAAGGFGGRLVPAGGVPVPVPAAIPVEPAEMRKLKLESIDRQLEGLQRTIDSIEKQKARLIEQKAELEKEAKKAEEKPAEKKDGPPVAPAEVK